MNSVSPIADQGQQAGPSALIDVRQVAELLDCSPRHVYRLSDAGKMPKPVHLGALVRWNRAEIDAWLAAGCTSTRLSAKARVLHG